MHAVAVRCNGGALACVEVLANLLGGVDLVVEVRDERSDGALEVNVVFPQGVIGIDEQGVARKARTRWWRWNQAHALILTGARMAVARSAMTAEPIVCRR